MDKLQKQRLQKMQKQRRHLHHHGVTISHRNGGQWPGSYYLRAAVAARSQGDRPDAARSFIQVISQSYYFVVLSP
eukprot:CAMPEP_0206498622 /NCGR_PEP_ID=MMETSP0324_2-20121206/51139_1 /ASSEMBLY_ACC=CAM_ASM_000836 /TAXON_ID=2866 /ORGANISM="Crypthecodinium cohnii, Strain Seligo" /LENGTH=74 /DNA_ID=CAMNT_0053984915 /DNA_START=60 /DNA_END=281 /DNA_ORIENTATION=-